MTRSVLILAAFVGALSVGCTKPDVGQTCNLKIAGTLRMGDDQLLNACNAEADWMESGETSCENLVCILTNASSDTCGSRTPVCSKPCVSDSDCFKDETGLVCRPVVLDEEAMNELDPDLLREYLGDIAFSNYCAYPKP